MALIIHIAPQLPPAICGVGDYAVLVGRRMEEVQPDVQCDYIACGHQAALLNGTGLGAGDEPILWNARRLWQAVKDRIDGTPSAQGDCALLVHYVGYGYHPLGAPVWLADALEQRPAWFSTCRIVSMFHELYATGWPWQRAFWNSSRQQAVAIRIARASDALMTNRAASARWLERVAGRPAGGVPSPPVPSNVGEPEEVTTWEERQPIAVLFGGARFKERFLVGSAAVATAEVCEKLGIESVYSIGASSGVTDKAFRSRGVHVIQTGILPAEEVSERFLEARIAFIDYFPSFYGKSGVFAASAAHGTPPILAVSRGASEGLRIGEHFWDLSAARLANRVEAGMRLSQMSQSILSWYKQHNTWQHAQVLAGLICSHDITVN